MPRPSRAPLGALVVATSIALACGGEREGTPALVGSEAALTAIDPHALHLTRAGAECMDCHMPHDGVFAPLVSFSDKARIPGGPEPVLEADRTCSNVACHMVPAGTFTFWFQGGDGEPALSTVRYGGVPVRTPPWPEATSDGCRACHGAPPSPAAGAWHSGFHGGAAGGALNACALCHPSVAAVNGALVIRTGFEAMHRNGIVDVAARFASRCFGCH